MKTYLNWVNGMVDIIVILGALYLYSDGFENWWMLLFLLIFTGTYKERV